MKIHDECITPLTILGFSIIAVTELAALVSGSYHIQPKLLALEP